MNVLIADKFEDRGIDGLRSAGCVVTIDPSLSGDALRDALAAQDYRVLVVRGTTVTAEMIDASAALSLVVRAGAGYDTIDIAAASRKSVFVANCPGKNAVAVAELTIGLILALDRRIVDATQDLRKQRWNKKLYSVASGLKGRTLGVIGVGQIGRAVIQRALGFEMRVIAWSRSLDEQVADELGVERMETIESVAATCDVLTIHLASTPETRQRIGRGVFDAMRPGTMFINTARAQLVDYKSLAQAVESKGLRVGLDVFEQEPTTSTGQFGDPLMERGGLVYGTHHIGACTEEAQWAIADETVRVVRTYAQTGSVENCVNISCRSPASAVLSVRHRNQPGVLAHTLKAISLSGVNVEEMENVICEGGEAACARIKLSRALEKHELDHIQSENEHIFNVTQSTLDNMSC